MKFKEIYCEFRSNSLYKGIYFHFERSSTRQRGYAIDDMEHEFGVKCVAMPIFDKTHKLYAAISVSGLAVHFTDDQIQEWALLIKKYVAKIENRLS